MRLQFGEDDPFGGRDPHSQHEHGFWVLHSIIKPIDGFITLHAVSTEKQ